MRNPLSVLALIGTALVLAGCGASQAKRVADPRRASAPSVCNPRALDAMARILEVAPETIATSKSIGNNDMPQCTFTARMSARRRVLAIVNVDSSLQPYQVLRRTIEEASQVFVPQRLSPAPINVPELGIAASWFPNYQWLKATDGLRLITASVNWDGSKQKQDIALAQTMIRPYLKTLSRRQVDAIVNGGSIP